MKSPARNAFAREMALARAAYAQGDMARAFGFLERAHILGQRHLTTHLATHWWMLKVGLRQGSGREIRGQLLRLAATGPGYLFGWVPKGNTGGANVSALKPMPIPPDLAGLLEDYSVGRSILFRGVGLLLAVSLGLVGAALWADIQRAREAALLDEQWKSRRVVPVADFGSTAQLEIVPLVNWHASSPGFKTEPGVSYLIRTDDQTILFDVGFNQAREDPSPLEHNMARLGVELDEIDAIFISHAHRDHVGGVEAERDRTFSMGRGRADLSGKAAFAPVSMAHPDVEVTRVSEPRPLMTGVASTGPIPRRLFLGRIDEQALVIHLAGRGLVLVVGCGHQTVPRLVERVEEVFAEPIYAIVGDLHYPVPRGRLEVFGIDAQRRLASGNGLFDPIGDDQVGAELRLLASKLSVVALGGHDTHDAVLNSFEAAFGKQFHRARVGAPIVLAGRRSSTPAAPQE